MKKGHSLPELKYWSQIEDIRMGQIDVGVLILRTVGEG